MEHLGIDNLRVGRETKQFGKSMSTASLLTSSRPSLPDIVISSECLKPQTKDARSIENTAHLTATPTNRRLKESAIGGRATGSSRLSTVIAVHGPGSLAKQRSPILETHQPGEVLGRIPSALPRTNSAKLGYYHWKKKHPWSYPCPKLVMKSIIQEKRRLAEELRSRMASLQQENIRLVEEVQNIDIHTDTETRDILEKYDRFMTNLTKLKQGYEERVEQAGSGLKRRQEQLEKDMRQLEIKLEEKEKSVKSSQDRLSSLISYQQKEFPLKAIVIYDLRGQVVRLSLSHEEEERELQRVIDEEKERIRERGNQEKLKIFQKITDIAVDQTPDNVKWLMRQNQDLKEEIKCQESHRERMTQEVEDLEKKVSEIRERAKLEREAEKVVQPKEDYEDNPELYGDTLEFPRQPKHIIL